MIQLSGAEVVVGDLTLPECPRWHDGALYFSDIVAGRVYRLRPDDSVELLYETTADFIGGLGFMEDGSLVVVSSKQCRLLRIRNGVAEPLADLRGLSRFVLNDMIVDAGHCFVSQPGYDVWTTVSEGMPEPTDLLLANRDGDVTVASPDMLSPNGMAVSGDGRTLYVAESTGMRITCFTIDPDSGRLSGRRVFGVLPDGGIPDGICLDDEGAVWAAVPVAAGSAGYGAGPGVIRMVEGGEGTHLVPIEKGRRALACALGGVDRSSLYVCTVPDFHGATGFPPGGGRIERVSVPFAGAGKP